MSWKGCSKRGRERRRKGREGGKGERERDRERRRKGREGEKEVDVNTSCAP